MCSKKIIKWAIIAVLAIGCKKDKEEEPPDPPPPPTSFAFNSLTINNQFSGFFYYNITTTPVVKFSFSAPVDKASVSGAIRFVNKAGENIAYSNSYERSDSVLLIQPSSSLQHLTHYTVAIARQLKSTNGSTLLAAVEVQFVTQIDSAYKFPVITNEALLTKVQQQTFQYFWDFAHPVSGMARERSNGDNNIVTSGGSGFGIMAIPVAIERNFITRAQGLERLQKIVAFLKNTAVKIKGAFPHWINGTTGAVQPFSANDNGADIVETSFLMMGLLTARQYFDQSGAEAILRNDITALYNAVEWDWFRRENQNVLYWHYSDDKQWAMNLPIRGWNECLVTYILAAASPAHSIPKTVYDQGWARNGDMRNGNTYYGHALPLGPNMGGPLFLSHYSFLGVDPMGLSDTYANYETQVKNHTLINYAYTVANPNNFYGYSDSVWGLTASDIPGGYTASSPTNDRGVIAPTAALSSFPYTPEKAMAALHFYYYVLGDKLWKEYGFIDAFSLKDQWFADSHLAIDQAPIIIMIENYRTGLVWDLFTSCPEVKNAMLTLGFSAPYL